jgi:integrase
MASIHPNGTGFRVHYVREGQRLKSPTLPSMAAAEAWQRDHLAAQAAPTITALAELWRAEAPSPHRDEAAYRVGLLALREAWGRADRLALADLRTWVARDPSHGHPAQYLMTILRWAAEVHRIPIAPEVLAYRPPKPKRKAPPILLTDAQVETILDCATGYGAAAFAVVDYLLTYGARPITACRLTVDDVNFLRGELVIRDAKHSGGWRHKILPRHVEGWERLARPIQAAPAPLFPHYQEARPWAISRGSAAELTNWYKNTIGKRLKLAAVGLDGIYHLKRWAITRMLRSGLDPATVATFTGHRDLGQVMTYNVSNQEAQVAALANLDRVPGRVPKFLDSKS